MAWMLDIHLIDVGQGDSTLIDVYDDVNPLYGRTMLIDGGESAYARTVHDYILHLGLPRVTHFVCTHYDKDHRGGLHALLLADDLTNVAWRLTLAANANTVGANRPERIASVTGAVYSAAEGNWGPVNSMLANGVATVARTSVGAGATDAQAVGVGVQVAVSAPNPAPALLTNHLNRRAVARAVALAAADAIDNGQAGPALTATVSTAVFDNLRRRVAMQQARFWTGNRYNNTHVIDLGDGDSGLPAGWTGAISGQFTMSGNAARTSFPARMRTSLPVLGSELLWGSGPAAIAPPPGAPRVYAVARGGWVWQGVNAAAQQVTLAPTGNNRSIGLVVQFNDFLYSTFGDLGSVGEDPLMTALTTQGLPDLAGGVLPLPDCLASFKVSHHGSKSSTSVAFLNAAQPVSALVSSGFHLGHQHPDESLVFRLHTQASIRNYFLTNCKFQTHVVPATNQQNQLLVPGNKSLVAGDNADVNLAPGRHRGDIRLRITEDQSNAMQGAGRQYSVRYWEDDLVPPGPRMVTEPF
ncbi:MAG: hypothetical protein HOV87_30985 [Catenulispora sp.]|nr:hypothetical protein [Catenulispora sp.]